MPSDWIGLFISGGFSLVLATMAAFFARRGAKLSNKETRAPDVQEMWVQQEADRRARRAAEDVWWHLWRAFQSFYRRIITASATWDLTEEQRKVLDLTPKEQAAIDARIPED